MSRIVSGGRGLAVPEQGAAHEASLDRLEKSVAEAARLAEQLAVPEEQVLGKFRAAQAVDQLDQGARPMLSMGDSVSGTIFASFEPFETEPAASASPAAAGQVATAQIATVQTAVSGDPNPWAKLLKETLAKSLTFKPEKPEDEKITVLTPWNEAEAIRWYEQAASDSESDLAVRGVLTAAVQQFDEAAAAFVRDFGASRSIVASLRQTARLAEESDQSDPNSRKILEVVDALTKAHPHPTDWEAILRDLAEACEKAAGQQYWGYAKQKAKECLEPLRRDLEALEFIRKLAAAMSDGAAELPLPGWAASKADAPAQKALSRLATAAAVCSQAASAPSASRPRGYEPPLSSEAAALKSARAHGVPEEKLKQVLRTGRTAVPAEPEAPGRFAMPETRHRYQVALAAREEAVAQSNLDELLNRLALEADPAECRRKVRREVRLMGASVPNLRKLAQDAGLGKLGDKSEQAKALIRILLDPSQPDEMWEAALGQLRPLVEDDWKFKSAWLALTYDQVALDGLPKLLAAACDRSERSAVFREWENAAAPVAKAYLSNPRGAPAPLDRSLLDAARRLHKALSSLEPSSAERASEG